MTDERWGALAAMVKALGRQPWTIRQRGAEVWIVDADGQDVCDLPTGPGDAPTPQALATAKWIAGSLPALVEVGTELVDAQEIAQLNREISAGAARLGQVSVEQSVADLRRYEAELATLRGQLALQQTAHDREVERLEADLAAARERATRAEARARQLDIDLGHAQIRHAAVVEGRAEERPAPQRSPAAGTGRSAAEPLEGRVWWRCKDCTVWDTEVQARRWHAAALRMPYLAPVKELARETTETADLPLPKGRTVYGRLITRVRVWPPRETYEEEQRP